MGDFKYKFDELFNPLIDAIHQLGGSASVSEIEDKVAGLLSLSEKEINDIHRGNRTKFSYRLAWTRNYLKRYGILENSSRGIWAFTKEGKEQHVVDEAEVKKMVKEIDKNTIDSSQEETEYELTWKDNLLQILYTIEPGQFERLCQRMLRELGFINVEVIGKSGDGGIDGLGVIRMGGVLSFHVVFQCKRYRGSIGPSIVRDFRGAMVGRADRGLLITTGTFTSEAKKESKRDGAPPIDLIDGEDLTEKLKHLELGIQTELIESITILEDWYKDF